MVNHNSCPVCTSTNLIFFLRCKDHLINKEEFNIYKCAECGFMLTQDHPDEQVIGDYYLSESYISHSDTQKGLFNSLYHLARRLMLMRKKVMVKRASGMKRGSLLDIGSGTGYFAHSMKRSGWMVAGTEVDQTAREFSVNRFAINVFHPRDLVDIPSEEYNCITLWHVLEHIEHLDDYFKEIDRLLKPGGVCLVALPNHSSFDAGYYKKFWAAYDVPRHLWHFSRESFGILAENHNFDIIDMIPLPFDAFYISILSEKNRGTMFALVSGLIIGSVSAVISLFRPERTSSLVYIIKKKPF